MRRDQQRDAALALQFPQQVQEPGGRGAVEVRGRLVGDHHGRVAGQRAGDRDALLLAADEMILKTSTHRAPWVIVEANDKLYARVKVLRTVERALRDDLARDRGAAPVRGTPPGPSL